jgi:hypothetical protein
VDDYAEADRRLCEAMADGQVEWASLPNHALVFMLDEVVDLRHRRRAWFWTSNEAGDNIPAHLPNECVVVRAAVAEWRNDYNEPPSLCDLLASVEWYGGYDEVRAAHAVLNALDAGAIRVSREAMETRWYLSKGWTQS